MTIRRTITFLLAVLTAASLLASCGDSSSAIETAAGTDAAENAAAVETDAPEEKYLEGVDLEGETLTLFCTDYENTNAYYYIYTEEADGDVVRDAVFEKNLQVSELLNVKLDFHKHHFDWADRSVMYDAVRGSVMSGDNSFQITLIPTYFTSTLVSEGLMADLSSLPYVDFDRSWWSQGFRETAEIGGKTYMAAGDAVLPFVTGYFCIAYNCDLAHDLGIHDMYGIVTGGEWTLDKLAEYSSGVYSDINGNGEYDDADLYGLEILNGNFLLPFITSCSIPAFTRVDGGYEFTYDSSRAVSVYDKLFSLIHDKNATYLTDADVSGNIRADSPFVAGRALFTGINLVDTDHFRDLSFTYSVLPYPKYDEEQSQYYTFASNGAPSIAVTILNEGSEAVGAVMEAMGYYGEKVTTPAYFEIALKVKYSSDNETSALFDIIRKCEHTQTPEMFAAAIDAPMDTFKSTLRNASNEGMWTSTVAKKKDAWIAKLDAFIAAVEANG